MLYRLQELVNYAKISNEDSLVFTYLGGGSFAVVVFDKFRVEKIYSGNGLNLGKYLINYI